MHLHVVDPVEDPSWMRLVDQHPRASVFHTAGWLKALCDTYGYTPVALTPQEPGEALLEGVPFCHVRSRLTGSRLVSLPFSDHCEPLVESPSQLNALVASIPLEITAGCRYVELRPVEIKPTGWGGPGVSYYLHQVDLRPGSEYVYQHLHKDSVQRKIRRAEREKLEYREGRSSELLRDFYGLMVGSRRRQGLPPQPWNWFVKLADTLGEALKVRVAFKENVAVAAILTLLFRDRMVYKYGASEPEFNAMGGMHLLLWRTVEDACAAGAEVLDLGRTDLDQEGLIVFKERWGATRHRLTYIRNPAPRSEQAVSGIGRFAAVFRVMPLPLLRLVGRVIYRHAG